MSAGTQAYEPQAGVRYAHWGWRVLSSLIDTTLFYLPLFMAVGGLNALGMVDAEGNPAGVLANAVFGGATVLAFTLAILNRSVFDGRGQSLGRWVTGTRLVSARSGRPVGAGRALLRTLCHVLDSMSLYIGWLLPLFTAERQTLADLVMRTVVVRRR